MTRFLSRRLITILVALLLANLFGYAYAHLVLPIRASRIPYLQAPPSTQQPLVEAYGDYLQGAVRLDFGDLPGREQDIAGAIFHSVGASLGLLVLALAASVAVGLGLGLRAARPEGGGVSRWLTLLTTIGLALPSFYIGSVLIMALFTYVLQTSRATPLPMGGFGWDQRLILPALALMVRPTVQIAQMSASLMEEELGKRYIVTARSIGHPWSVVRRRHALRCIYAPLVLTVASSFRLMMGELILIEWLFNWPGLGRLFAQALVPGQLSTALGSPFFLNPPVVATVLTAFAAFFLISDLIATLWVRAVDPRLRETDEGVSSTDVISARSGFARRNWGLFVGGVIVLLVIGIAIYGPKLALHDPQARNSIIQMEDGWQTAPFPPFTVPGYPLGSDDYGRDLLSRLLWAVRPTMILVAGVALIRLIGGTLAGLTAGWSTGRIGRGLDLLISGALSVPVLMIALGVIAAVGNEFSLGWSLAAFVFGLSVTGWAEVAKVIRERTRLVKGQQYIEAAQALGEPRLWILGRHVLPQVMPVVWMMFALEISSSLMTVAGLGFLGYYIGGDVWIEVGDFVARKASLVSELGQMLATSNTGIARLGLRGLPLAMLAVGAVIFIVVLGFNLLGAGLRQRLSVNGKRKHTPLSDARWRVKLWLDARVTHPLSLWMRAHPALVGAVGVLFLLAVGVLAWQLLQFEPPPEPPAVVLEVPGEHLWGSPRRDPYNTTWHDVVGPIDPSVLWVFEDPAGFSGGPVVSADGTLYVVSEAGTLYSLDVDGDVLWSLALGAEAVGGPVLGLAGEIYVADKEGGLSVVTSAGIVAWRFQSETSGAATSGPTVGPDGTIYYAVRSNVQAVSPDGASLWSTRVPHDDRSMPLHLSPDDSLLFWENVILDAQEGTLLDLQVPFDVDQYITGADGRTYLRVRETVVQWQPAGAEIELIETARWDARALGTLAAPIDAGVTPQREMWLLYSNIYAGSWAVWLDPSGRVLDTDSLDIGRGQVTGVGPGPIIYICSGWSSRANPTPECMAVPLDPEVDGPAWVLPLEQGEMVMGSALLPGRIYATVNGMEGGFLYAIGDE